MGGVKKQINVKKTSLYALIINSLQIVMTAVIAGYILFVPGFASRARLMQLFIICAAALVIWGATVDIREAIAARKSLLKIRDMEAALENIEQLNQTLRSQRHDFLNHLQVVYSLMEMAEYQEANTYIEEVYGSIASVSRALKTRNTAVNALMQVKFAQMEQAGIHCEVSIRSDWEHLPMPGWEMCRVLSNLIDNAMDAVSVREDRQIFLTISENLKQYSFEVGNNGPEISEKMRQNIFMPGVTTKSHGHGMGLFIVKKTLAAYGGDVSVASDAERTVFKGFVPKLAASGTEAAGKI